MFSLASLDLAPMEPSKHLGLHERIDFFRRAGDHAGLMTYRDILASALYLHSP